MVDGRRSRVRCTDVSIICALHGQTFHVSHDKFNKNGYGVFNERGEWNFELASQELQREGTLA